MATKLEPIEQLFSIDQNSSTQKKNIIIQQQNLLKIYHEILKISANVQLLSNLQQLTIEEQFQDQILPFKLTKILQVSFSCIHFQNLLKINITEQKINNLQFLTFLDAPVLQELNLSENKIFNVKSLNKTNFKKLSKISLIGNTVSQLNLGRMRLPGSPIDLLLQEEDNPQQTIMQDLSQLVKLQTDWIYRLSIEGENRIPQQNLTIFTLQKRFHKIDENKGIRSIKIYEKDGMMDFDSIKK